MAEHHKQHHVNSETTTRPAKAGDARPESPWWSPSRIPGALLIAVAAGLIVLSMTDIAEHLRFIWV